MVSLRDYCAYAGCAYFMSDDGESVNIKLKNGLSIIELGFGLMSEIDGEIVPLVSVRAIAGAMRKSVYMYTRGAPDLFANHSFRDNELMLDMSKNGLISIVDTVKYLSNPYVLNKADFLLHTWTLMGWSSKRLQTKT
jgi:hypothetical protein